MTPAAPGGYRPGAGAYNLPCRFPRWRICIRPEIFARSRGMIEVDGLTKFYGEFPAVRNLSFAVQPGEVMGLVGPNGAGKTTTLRCCTGVIPPTQGTVRIDGADLARGAGRRQAPARVLSRRAAPLRVPHRVAASRLCRPPVRRRGLRGPRAAPAGRAGDGGQARSAARRAVARHEAEARHRLRAVARAAGDLLRRAARPAWIPPASAA